VIAIDGPLDPGLLTAAWGRVVADHEILRTAFPRLHGMQLPLQVVSEVDAPALRFTDLGQLNAGEVERAAERLLDEAALGAPALDTPPLVAVTLVRLSAHAHLLLIDGPALCLDAPSIGLLARRLGETYEACSGHGQTELRQAVQYVDVSEWSLERLTAADQEHEAGRAYWQQMLAGPTEVRFPWERPSPRSSFQGARMDSVLSGDLAPLIGKSAAAGGASPAEFLLTCWQVLLVRLTGQQGLVCGVLHEGRIQHELEGCLGPLARMLPARAELRGDWPLAVALDAAHRGREAADRWHDVYPLPQGHHFPFCFEYQTRPTWSGAGLRFTVKRSDAQADRYRLKLVCAHSESELAVELHYDSSRLTAADARRVLDSYEAVVGSAAEAVDTPVGELRILAPAERQTILHAAAATVGGAEPEAVHRMIEKQGRDHPNRTAVRCGDQSLTYGQLEERAARLASELQELGVGPDATVGICLPRSSSAAVAILGVLKSGAAWLPLDPSLPPERIDFMLRDTGAGVVVTQHPLEREPALRRARCVLVDALGSESAKPPPVEGWPSHSDDLAYLMYTSGSTGQPKGVMITHGALSHYVRSMRERLQVTSDDVYLHTAAFAFSSSVRQLLVPLAAGASVVLATADETREPHRLLETIRRAGVTIIDLVPSYLGVCLTTLEGMVEPERVRLLDNALRLLLTASEPLLSSEPQRWRRALPRPVPMVNMFGQTETTGIVTTHPVQGQDEEPVGIVPVGRPIANMRVYVLDARGHPVPRGVVGELYVGGPGLGRGYLPDPASPPSLRS